MKYLENVAALNLPVGKFAIFASGPICIRGIRENDDIDIIVTKELLDELQQKNTVIKKPGRSAKIQIGPVEIYSDWKPWYDDVTEFIETAEIIDGLPFVKIEYVLDWKKKFAREKDIKDIMLIEKYLSKKELDNKI